MGWLFRCTPLASEHTIHTTTQRARMCTCRIKFNKESDFLISDDKERAQGFFFFFCYQPPKLSFSSLNFWKLVHIEIVCNYGKLSFPPGKLGGGGGGGKIFNPVSIPVQYYMQVQCPIVFGGQLLGFSIMIIWRYV